MYLIRGLQNIKLFKNRFPESEIIATIGNFDGLHLGHQKIISDMKEKNMPEKVKEIMVIRLSWKTFNLSACLPSQNNVNALIIVATA